MALLISIDLNAKIRTNIRHSQDNSWYHSTNCKNKIKLTCIEFFGSIVEK